MKTKTELAVKDTLEKLGWSLSHSGESGMTFWMNGVDGPVWVELKFVSPQAKEFFVVATNRVNSPYAQCLPRSEAEAIHGKEIENPDGSSWGQWEIVSVPVTKQEGDEMANEWNSPTPK